MKKLLAFITSGLVFFLALSFNALAANSVNPNQTAIGTTFIGTLTSVYKNFDNGFASCAQNGCGARVVDIITQAGLKVDEIQSVTLLDLKRYTGSGTSKQITCPTAYKASYDICVENTNDGTGNYVLFGVIKKANNVFLTNRLAARNTAVSWNLANIAGQPDRLSFQFTAVAGDNTIFEFSADSIKADLQIQLGITVDSFLNLAGVNGYTGTGINADVVTLKDGDAVTVTVNISAASGNSRSGEIRYLTNTNSGQQVNFESAVGITGSATINPLNGSCQTFDPESGGYPWKPFNNVAVVGQRIGISAAGRYGSLELPASSGLPESNCYNCTYDWNLAGASILQYRESRTDTPAVISFSTPGTKNLSVTIFDPITNQRYSTTCPIVISSSITSTPIGTVFTDVATATYINFNNGYANCTKDGCSGNVGAHLKQAGLDLNEVKSATLLKLAKHDGAGSAKITTDCDSKFDVCVENKNDGNGNSVKFGVIKTNNVATTTGLITAQPNTKAALYDQVVTVDSSNARIPIAAWDLSVPAGSKDVGIDRIEFELNFNSPSLRSFTDSELEDILIAIFYEPTTPTVLEIAGKSYVVSGFGYSPTRGFNLTSYELQEDNVYIKAGDKNKETLVIYVKVADVNKIIHGKTVLQWLNEIVQDSTNAITLSGSFKKNSVITGDVDYRYAPGAGIVINGTNFSSNRLAARNTTVSWNLANVAGQPDRLSFQFTAVAGDRSTFKFSADTIKTDLEAQLGITIDSLTLSGVSNYTDTGTNAGVVTLKDGDLVTVTVNVSVAFGNSRVGEIRHLTNIASGQQVNFESAMEVINGSSVATSLLCVSSVTSAEVGEKVSISITSYGNKLADQAFKLYQINSSTNKESLLKSITKSQAAKDSFVFTKTLTSSDVGTITPYIVSADGKNTHCSSFEVHPKTVKPALTELDKIVENCLQMYGGSTADCVVDGISSRMNYYKLNLNWGPGECNHNPSLGPSYGPACEYNNLTISVPMVLGASTDNVSASTGIYQKAINFLQALFGLKR